MNQEHFRFQKGDLLAMALIAMLAVLVAIAFLPKDSSQPVMAEVYRDGALIKTLDLSEDATFVVSGNYTNTVTVAKGSVAITSSDCPGEDCVHSAPIQSTGRSIVCLPNGVEVRVVNGQSDVDFVVG